MKTSNEQLRARSMPQRQKSTNFLQMEADDGEIIFPLLNDYDISYLGNLYVGSPN